MIQSINAFKTQGNTIAATSMMVWAHTIRATTLPELKELGCFMWGELARGFAGTEKAAAAIAARTNNEKLNIIGASRVPFTLDSNVEPEAAAAANLPYRLLVDDNFHYMDKSERYEFGSFETYEEALRAAKKIVDDFLTLSYKPGITKEELYLQYTSFGDDPFISSSDPTQSFSGWEYAKSRCKQICEEEWWHDE